jgi:tight adherence protein B
MSVRLVLLGACLCLVGLAFSFLLVNRAQERSRRLATRLAQTLGPGSGTSPTFIVQKLRVSVPVAKRSALDRVAGFFGADMARTDLYPIAWWLVPPLAFIPARLVAMVLEFLVGPMAIFVVPFACWLVCWKYFSGRHAQRVTVLFQQMPEALAMIVRAVRVGIPVSEAIRVVAHEAAKPTCFEFARLADDVAIGSPLDEALRNMAERNGVPEYRFFATALSLQAQTGGGISETLENLADVIRKRVAARARGKALAAEARTSALVLSVLPVLALATLWLMNPDYVAVLFDTEPGHMILASAALLLTVGTFVMRTMIHRSLS